MFPTFSTFFSLQRALLIPEYGGAFPTPGNKEALPRDSNNFSTCNSLKKFQIFISIQCCNIFVQERISSEGTESPGTRCASQIQILTTWKSHAQFYYPLLRDKLEKLHRNTNIIKTSLVSDTSQRITLLWEPKVILMGRLESKSVIPYKSCNFHYGEQRPCISPVSCRYFKPVIITTCFYYHYMFQLS